MSEHESAEFDQRRRLQHHDLEGIDLEALRFARSWHRFPLIQEALWYNGINLGEVMEHALIERIVSILHRQAGTNGA